MMKATTRLSLLIAAATVSGLATQTAHAAGFSLLEQNSSGLGVAYAGAAAIAEDASTVYFNGAGLTQLKSPQVVLNMNALDIHSTFRDEGSGNASGQPLGSAGGNAGSTKLVPSFYAAVPLTNSMTGGVGINAPFGLATEYSADWLGRFQGINSDVKTLNVNTTLAFKLTPTLSLGVGLDYQSLEAKLTKAINYTAIVAAQSLGTVVVPALQGDTAIKGSDSAWGFDVGLLYTPTEALKVGLSYRSGMKYDVEGDAVFNNPSPTNTTARAIVGAVGVNGPVTLDIELPAIARFAAAYKIHSDVELLGEVSWTQWSKIPELRINRSTGTTLSVTDEQWEDTWRVALGLTYQATPGLKLRTGVARDDAPVPDSTRTPRLPDNDRTWVSVGAQAQLSKSIAVDFGYSSVSAKDARLNQADGNAALNGSIVGKQKTRIDIVGIQATVNF